ncbi:hypothetical protein L5515_009317 [Caenorhabditis briggsae]|uniref:Uncharacterized protein n=1 Tax=Caenorhabditis briggsae TaxID=6238 RepID=A0AAE9JNJ2_CAEBR|nr:hypothetical protein L5515_009317 [Caenorhabditis briggsae]
MKKFVVFFAALLVVISSFGVLGQPNYEPQHYPNVPIGDNSVMNVQEVEKISHLASRFFFDSKNGDRRGGNAGRRGNRGHGNGRSGTGRSGTGRGGNRGRGGNNPKKVTKSPS